MIKSFHINNYRNIRDLSFKNLSRVNLFAGRNNTGKSTLLEAVYIFTTKANINNIYQLLEERGDNINQKTPNKCTFESNLDSLSSLFYNREVKYNKSEIRFIATNENNENSSVALQIIAYNEKRNNLNQGIILERIKLEEPKINNYHRVGFEIIINDIDYINFPIDQGNPYRYGVHSNIAIPQNIQFFRTRNIDRDGNGKLWDNITLTDKEKSVIEALQIIEKSTERINFVENENKERSAVIKLNGDENIYPLKSMGDGINRILSIILALVNSDGGYLLIDEFENGLHFSIQDKIWEIIFKLSQKLNIQVFITTHSDDCIKSFSSVMSKMNCNDLCGKLFRLDEENGDIVHVDYDQNELKIAFENNIEVR